jgi:hypothetical protein
MKLADALKKVTKASIKPPGPPRVWEVLKKTGKDGRPLTFTIQEIPEDRNEEAVEHMCKYFLADEPMCACFNAVNAPIYVEEAKLLWQHIIKEGIAVAAFIDNPKGGKPIMAGINMLCMEYKEFEEAESDIKFESKFRITYEVMTKLKKGLRLYERYGADKCLYAFGLAVEPGFRGYGLGTDILKIRDKVGRAYNVPMTTTAFTSPYSKKSADNAGFETLLTKNYVDLVDENGKEYFPGIHKFSNSISIMAKRLV